MRVGGVSLLGLIVLRVSVLGLTYPPLVFEMEGRRTSYCCHLDFFTLKPYDIKLLNRLTVPSVLAYKATLL